MDSVKVTLMRPDIVPASPPMAAATERAAEQLRERIISGSLRRGQTLSARDLGHDLGAPVGVMREALSRLCDEGYAMRNERSIVVAPFCLEARQLLKRRLPLEVRLTRLAARRLTPFGLRLLDQIRHEMIEAQHRYDLLMVQRGNYRFHNLLYRFADRPDLLAEVQMLWAGFPFDLMTTMPSRMPAVADEHAAVLAMLRVGDVRRAGEAMRFHILHGWQEFQRHYPLRLERQARRAP